VQHHREPLDGFYRPEEYFPTSRYLDRCSFCINQDDIPEKNVQVAQMRDVYTGSKKTLAHLGPRFDGLETLVAYRACFWTKYWFFPRPPTLRTVHAVSSRTRNCESEPNSIGFRPGHDAEAHSIFRPTLWTFIYFPDANRSDNCYWFHRLGSRLHT
jgi:hypothetical protein